MKKRIKLLALFAALHANAYAQNATPQGGLLVKPATVHFTVSDGEVDERKIQITNNLPVKKQFVAYFNDWQRDSVGGHIYQDPNTTSRSCASWVSVDQAAFELESGQSTQLTVKIKVPDSVSANEMKWAMLFIETINEKKPVKTDGVTASIVSKFRFGVHIYETPRQVVGRDVRMLQFSAKPNAKDSVYSIVCHNVGETMLQCKTYLELSNVTTGTKVVTSPIEFPMFPGQKRYVDVALPKDLPKGKYVLMGALDAGEDVPLEAAQTTIEIK